LQLENAVTRADAHVRCAPYPALGMCERKDEA
jgi:hypothetical protein